MAALARELFMRKARGQWYYGVAHIASEANLTADRLSRLAQPSVVPLRPKCLRHATEVDAPNLQDLWQL